MQDVPLMNIYSENIGRNMEDKIDVVQATEFLIEYCKKNRPFSYNDYMERSAFETLKSILRFHKTGSVHRTATMVNNEVILDTEEEYGI